VAPATAPVNLPPPARPARLPPLAQAERARLRFCNGGAAGSAGSAGSAGGSSQPMLSEGCGTDLAGLKDQSGAAFALAKGKWVELASQPNPQGQGGTTPPPMMVRATPETTSPPRATARRIHLAPTA